MAAHPLPGPEGIHDALVTPLTPDEDGRLPILAFEDHLLRRFGRVEIVRLNPGLGFRVLRIKADEVWTLIEGSADLRLEDTRAGSPTSGARQSVVAESPTRVLIPFGVRLHVSTASAAVLLRVMTHSEAEDPPAREAG